MRVRFAALVKLVAVTAAGLMGLALAAVPATASPPASPGAGRHQAVTPIKHFIFLMQGGRTFDNYFGTFPGADGIPANACQPYVASRPTGGCVKPFLLDSAQQE